ncbi:hypothetical protein NM208_g13093 [Fusarium decemcellulare]|uniref:Uncharacterized protein n=1 Tax=Fusarium decemcellulare TaxID=57161 RepID=A0ACC1RPN9_9HYPO|nr:hypothetical protein NM208_g13093 [Fusarium decemcellulare]
MGMGGRRLARADSGIWREAWEPSFVVLCEIDGRTWTGMAASEVPAMSLTHGSEQSQEHEGNLEILEYLTPKPQSIDNPDVTGVRQSTETDSEKQKRPRFHILTTRRSALRRYSTLPRDAMDSLGLSLTQQARSQGIPFQGRHQVNSN